MRALACLWLSATAAAATPDVGRTAPPARALPSLAGATSASGPPAPEVLQARGLPLAPAPPPTGGGPTWTAHAAFGDGALLLDATVEGHAAGREALAVTLFFPGSDAAAGGYTFRFGSSGKLPSREGDPTPARAWAAVSARATPSSRGFTVAAAFPPISWPRFPARGPVALDLCLSLRPGPGAPERSNCMAGAMAGGPLALPPGFRAGLEIQPPARVTSLEARDGGWLGYDGPGAPVWVASRAPMSAETLEKLLGEPTVDPASVRMALPAKMRLHTGATLLPLLLGSSPFGQDGRCDEARQLRLVIFLLKEHAAERVLEWPASTCALGQATSAELDEEDALTVGYSTGAQATFTWSTDHFERTEIGKR